MRAIGHISTEKQETYVPRARRHQFGLVGVSCFRPCPRQRVVLELIHEELTGAIAMHDDAHLPVEGYYNELYLQEEIDARAMQRETCDTAGVETAEKYGGAMYVKTKDCTYAYLGYSGCDSRCRIELYEATGKPPVIIATELPDNPGTLVTNMAEELAAQVVATFCPQAFEAVAVPAFIWIERYGPGVAHKRASLSVVTFSHAAPRLSYRHSRQCLSLGTPDCRGIEREALESLLGQPYPEPVQLTHEEQRALYRAHLSRRTAS